MNRAEPLSIDELLVEADTSVGYLQRPASITAVRRDVGGRYSPRHIRWEQLGRHRCLPLARAQRRLLPYNNITMLPVVGYLAVRTRKEAVQ